MNVVITRPSPNGEHALGVGKVKIHVSRLFRLDLCLAILFTINILILNVPF